MFGERNMERRLALRLSVVENREGLPLRDSLHGIQPALNREADDVRTRGRKVVAKRCRVGLSCSVGLVERDETLCNAGGAARRRDEEPLRLELSIRIADDPT